MTELANVVNLRSGRMDSTRPAAVELLAEARVMLNGTIESLESDRERLETSTPGANVFHLALVEKIKELLIRVCQGKAASNQNPRFALSMVELARMALIVGPVPFEGSEHLLHEITVADALQAALDRLDSAELANG